MLKTLRAHNIALIDDIEVEFSPGFNVLTGETGAGKSLLIGAINLLRGEKASTDLIGPHDSYLEVEGVFVVPPHFHPRFLAYGVDPSPSVRVSRRISSSGKNRVLINGELFNVSALRELVAPLVDLHGQHENQRLFDPETHIVYLDSFYEEIAPVLSEYGAHYLDYRKLISMLEAMSLSPEERQRRIDFLKFQIEMIDKVSPKPGELESLEQEYELLSNAQQITESLASALDLLYSSETSAYEEVSLALKNLQKIASYDPDIETVLGELEGVSSQIEGISDLLREKLSIVKADPERLLELEERISSYEELIRRFGPTIEDVLKKREEMEKELEFLETQEERTEEIKKELEQKKKILEDLAGRLTELREKASEEFSKLVTKHINEMGMEGAVFTVSLSEMQDDFGPRGKDRVEFLIMTNPGSPLKPLRKIASGGEISRVMLAIKSVLAEKDRVPVIIFDEIDVGVSGKVAESVGRKMAQLARYHQVFAVTHLPQIASGAGAHYIVEKTVERGVARTRVRRLTVEERVREIARLLAGEEITQTALEHARSLLRDIISRQITNAR